MLLLSFGQWSGSSGSIFVRRRIYLGGRWTPFVVMRRRYPLRSFYRGTWPVNAL